MKNIMYFRNDDVRHNLDDSLIKITNLFISHGIPITHAVEPANISSEVVIWLTNVKMQHPQLINIIQHGYDHTIKNKLIKGEFGGQRTYKEQLMDIKKGKEIMDSLFGSLWFPAFSFPYSPYNPEAIEALNDCGYKVLNSHFSGRISRRIFYKIGHIMRRGYLLNHHVSWNLKYYPKTKLFEIDVNTSFIKRYYNELTDCDMMTLKEIINETIQHSKYRTVGVLLHHRYHNNDAKLKLVDDYLKWCKSNQNNEFWSLNKIYANFS